MPHSPFATSEILTQAEPCIFLAFDRRYRVGQVLDHQMLLLGIEHILDEMNFYHDIAVLLNGSLASEICQQHARCSRPRL
jgi:hypothetical protein